MSKLLSDSDKELLDNMYTSMLNHTEATSSIKKEILSQLEKNSVTSSWKFIKKYNALKYLDLV